MTRTPKRAGYYALVLIFVLTWASAFTATKFALPVSPPLLFLGIRFALAGVLLLAFAASRGELRGARLWTVPWAALCVLGVFNQAGNQGPSWEGMRTVSAGLGTIINSTNPILVAVLAAPLLGERLTWRKIAGLLLGVAGVAVIVRDHVALGEDWTGVLWLVLALISVVIGTIGFKRLRRPVSLTIAVGAQQLAAGALLLAIGGVTEDARAIVLGPQFVLTMLWVVFVISVGSMTLWFHLLRRGTATEATSLHFLVPPAGILIAWAAVGEPVRPLDMLGVAPVALGIWLATRPERTALDSTRPAADIVPATAGETS